MLTNIDQVVQAKRILCFLRVKSLLCLFLKLFSTALCSTYVFKTISYENLSIFFHVSVSVSIYIYMLVFWCVVDCGVILIRIKRTVSININWMFISFSDGFLACTAVGQVIT